MVLGGPVVWCTSCIFIKLNKQIKTHADTKTIISSSLLQNSSTLYNNQYSNRSLEGPNCCFPYVPSLKIKHQLTHSQDTQNSSCSCDHELKKGQSYLLQGRACSDNTRLRVGKWTALHTFMDMALRFGYVKKMESGTFHTFS